MTLKIVLKGGPGSGHHGHAGRPGSIGGSATGSGGGIASSTFKGSVGFDKMSAAVHDEWTGHFRRQYAADALTKVVTAGDEGMAFHSGDEFVGVASLDRQRWDDVGADKSYIYLSSFATKRSGIGRNAMVQIARKAVSENKDLVLHSTLDAKGFFRSIGMLPSGDDDELTWSVTTMREAISTYTKGAGDNEPKNGAFVVDIGRKKK